MEADGQLMCAYHGWKFGSGGECTAIPQAPPPLPPSGSSPEPLSPPPSFNPHQHLHRQPSAPAGPPQAEKPVSEWGDKQKAECAVESYPTMEKAGLIWVWPEVTPLPPPRLPARVPTFTIWTNGVTALVERAFALLYF